MAVQGLSPEKLTKVWKILKQESMWARKLGSKASGRFVTNLSIDKVIDSADVTRSTKVYPRIAMPQIIVRAAKDSRSLGFGASSQIGSAIVGARLYWAAVSPFVIPILATLALLVAYVGAPCYRGGDVYSQEGILAACSSGYGKYWEDVKSIVAFSPQTEASLTASITPGFRPIYFKMQKSEGIFQAVGEWNIVRAP